MKVLWVKSGGFLPLDTGGKIRSYSILKELASRHDLDVFTFYPRQDNDRHHELHSFCNYVELMPMKLPDRATLGDMIAYGKNLSSSLPYSMVKYCRPEVASRLRQLLQQRVYDVIVCDYLLTAAVIPWETRCFKIVFTHNVEAMIWKRHWQVGRNPFWKMISWREYRRMARVENLYLKKADQVLTVSDADREFFSQTIAQSKLTTIPTGVDTEFFSPAPLNAERTNTLVFTGSMDWIPNEDAILFFAGSILPIIKRQVPNVKLFVVGRHPSSKLRALAAHISEIEVTGMVDDVRPYIERSSVYIVPLRIGGGTRIKIFEAMAMAKAVVSSSIGAEGLPVTHGRNIVIADQPELFASEVIDLLRNKQKRAEIGVAARELVQSKYTWRAVADVFDRVLAEATVGVTSVD